jgi:ATP synthase protein I
MKDHRDRDRVEHFRSMRAVGMLSTAGLTLALAVVVGVAIGYFLDRWLKTNGVLVIVFAIVGIIAGFKQFFQIVIRANRDQEEADERERSQRGPGNGA